MNLIRAFTRAEVAELVDALGSGSSRGFPVEVRVLSSAPHDYISRNSKGLRLLFFLGEAYRLLNRGPKAYNTSVHP